MARARLLECSFLIPTRRDRNLSDGKTHRPGAWEWLESGLGQFGGATRDTAATEGWYEDPDSRQAVWDVSRRYTVAAPRERVRHLRALLRQACLVFGQKCIYLSVAGHVEFVEGPHHEAR
jgi:hypothetical protein